MDWKNMGVEEVLGKLGTSIDGLSSGEALKRLRKYGENDLVEEKKETPLKLFLNQFMDVLIILLIVAAIAAYTIGDVIDSLVILFVVVVNAIIGFIQEYRAEKAMEKLKSLVATEAVVIRDGSLQRIPANQLTIGDIVVIEEGDNVPADTRLIETSDLRIDESIITGESIPLHKTHKTGEDNIAYMDSNVVSGRGKGVVVAVGMETAIGKIAKMIQEEEEKTPLQQKIEELGKNLGLIAVVVCFIVFIIQYMKNVNIVETFMTAVSLAVAAVPEGLPAILTLTLALGMQRMAKNRAVVRKLLAVETLGSCTFICTDKTGTLTLNKMKVRKSILTSREKALMVCALCNNASFSNGKIIGDPTDAALLLFAEENDYHRDELEEENPRITEIPLDSERKRMSTIHKTEDGDYLFIKGAPEIIMEKSTHIEEDGKIRRFEEADFKWWMMKLGDMTSKAMRVIALAYRPLPPGWEREDPEEDLIFLGLVGMMDPPREEAAEAIETCKRAGIQVVMITGDHKDTAVAIANELGLMGDGIALTGARLDELSDEEFESIVEDVKVYARVHPEQKVRIVKALQEKGHVVAMTGDGVNDAPALKRAAIGVAMGSGTDVAKESSDMVLQDDNFATIVRAVKEGRTIFDNIRRFVKFQLSTNIGAILTIFSSSLMNIPLPFNPVQILWINIIMDGPPAQSLGVEPPEEDIMLRKPRREDIIPQDNLLHILIAGIVMAAGTITLYLYELSMGDIKRAATIAFTVFVMFQTFNVFNCKSRTGFSNKLLVLAVTLSFILQLLVVYSPPLQGIFRTRALSVTDWIPIMLVASLIIVVEMIIRWFDKGMGS